MLSKGERDQIEQEFASALAAQANPRTLVTVIFNVEANSILLNLPYGARPTEMASFVIDACLRSRWTLSPSLLEMLLEYLVNVRGEGALDAVLSRVRQRIDPTSPAKGGIFIRATPERDVAGTAGMTAFVSYSHKDESYRQRLETSLSQLRRDKLISTWYDRKIPPGGTWDREINENLNSADIILLLVSPDFLASDYINSHELSRALERRRSGSAIVVPIILRPSDLEGSSLGALQALPREGRPVSKWGNRDEAWLDITRGLRRLIAVER